MKKISFLFFAVFIFSLSGCNSQDNKYQDTIIEYLETNDQTGIRTDLKIKFLEKIISDIFVSDSIAILEKQYQTEFDKKLKTAQNSVNHWQQSVDKHEAKKGDIVHKMLLVESTEKLNNAKSVLEEVQNWRPDYLDRYSGRDKNELIARSVKSKISFQNPKLSIRQEMDAIFILSPDGSEVYHYTRDK